MKRKQHIWFEFFVFLRPFWKHKILLFALLIIGNCGALASPLILKIIVDDVFPKRDIEQLLKVIMLLSSIYIVRIAAKFYSDYLYSWVSSKIMCNITDTLYNHVLQLPLRFFKNRSVGDLLQRISNEVGQVQNALTFTIINLINYSITIIALVVILCILHWKLFLLIVVLYPLAGAVLKYFDPKISREVKNIREKESALLGYFADRFWNIKSVKTMNAFSYEAQSVSQKLENLTNTNIRAAILASTSKNLSLFLLTLAPILILGYGGSQVISTALTLGTLIAFLQYTNKLHEPFQGLISLYMDMIKTTVSLGRIFELLSEPVAQSMINGKTEISDEIHSIRFCGVTKSYQNKIVLTKLDLTLEAGKKYAIVGPNGCGKSTLIELLTKLDEPEEGTIFVNGIDLQELTFSHWMNKICVTHQNTLLFGGTVEENLTYGNSSVHRANITDILQRVNLSKDVIAEKLLLKRNIGDGGSRLSGGQRQKIAIARALLRNAEIFVMDESASEIDGESEEMILRDIFGMSRFNIIIIVSHHLRALNCVDEIIYIENGQVLEKGSLSSLVEKKGGFFNLFKPQLESNHFLMTEQRA